MIAEGERADWLAERAALHRMRGDYGSALADLNDAYDLDPELDAICLQRGLVLSQLGFDEGEDDLSDYISLHPDHVRALMARAKHRRADGRLDGARQDYRRAIDLGASLDAYLALGKLDEDDDKLDDAAACYEKGLKALNGAHVLKLALVRVETARRNYARAIEVVDTMLASAAFKADALLRRADIHEAAGHEHKARADRIEALRLIDEGLVKRPTALRRLARARALLALNRAAEGMSQLEDVVDRAPDLEEARQLLQDAREAR